MDVIRIGESGEVTKETSKPKTSPIRTRENAAKLMHPVHHVSDFLSDNTLDDLVSWLRYFENHRKQGYHYYYAFADLTSAQRKQPKGIQFLNCNLRFVGVYITDTESIVSVSTKLLVSWLNQQIILKKREAK